MIWTTKSLISIEDYLYLVFRHNELVQNKMNRVREKILAVRCCRFSRFYLIEYQSIFGVGPRVHLSRVRIWSIIKFTNIWRTDINWVHQFSFSSIFRWLWIQFGPRKYMWILRNSTHWHWNHRNKSVFPNFSKTWFKARKFELEGIFNFCYNSEIIQKKMNVQYSND